jgi:hypothetical protein
MKLQYFWVCTERDCEVIRPAKDSDEIFSEWVYCRQGHLMLLCHLEEGVRFERPVAEPEPGTPEERLLKLEAWAKVHRQQADDNVQKLDGMREDLLNWNAEGGRRDDQLEARLDGAEARITELERTCL